jgi:hypothetical protein
MGGFRQQAGFANSVIRHLPALDYAGSMPVGFASSNAMDTEPCGAAQIPLYLLEMLDRACFAVPGIPDLLTLFSFLCV